MQKVEFSEENFDEDIPEATEVIGGIPGFLIKRGIAKDKAHANKIVLIVAIIIILVALYFYI